MSYAATENKVFLSSATVSCYVSRRGDGGAVLGAPRPVIIEEPPAMVATHKPIAPTPDELLTAWEQRVLVLCYADGQPEAVVADWYGKSRNAVVQTIRRAADKLQAAGFPRPRPHGRGNRSELRAALPMITRRVG